MRFFKTVDQCGGSAKFVRSTDTLRFRVAAVFVVMLCLFALWVAGTETTVATSSGQTFQITGTSVGGKVVTTKLPLPANSKIVTVNVPSSQGGMATFETACWRRRVHVTLIQCVDILSLHPPQKSGVRVFFVFSSPTPQTQQVRHLKCVI